MNAIARGILAGAAGALTTNLLHEATRRVVDAAPRVDILGMQALAKYLAQARVEPPVGKQLYVATLLSDLASNTLYFALTGCASGGRAVATGLLLGGAAGAGAVVLPPKMGLAASPTNRTALTQAVTVALYTLGGLAAGGTQYALSRTSSMHDVPTNGRADTGRTADGDISGVDD